MLAIWVLGRDSFQNSRGTVLAIERLGRIFKKNYGARRLRFGFWEKIFSKILGARCLGHGACDLVFGKRFCSKNLRDTVLAIWDLGRVSFFGFWKRYFPKLWVQCLRCSRNLRAVLAIWDLVFGKRFCSRNLRDTVLAIWDLGRVSFFGFWEKIFSKILGARCLRFGIWEKILLQKPKGHGACDLGFGKG